MRRSIALCLIFSALTPLRVSPAAETQYQFDGHTKGRFIAQKFPSNSILYSLAGSRALDFESDLRLNFQADRGDWTIHGAYQLFLLYGDRIEYSRQFPIELILAFDRLPNDNRRLMQLTDVVHDEGKLAVLQRLDRLWIGHTSDKTVLRIGRQAISWGNGFFFSPMDMVNPFDPTTIDTEYKAGDDMLYYQYLRSNGHDIQAAAVARRNVLTGDVDSGQATLAVKYHGVTGDAEYDLLLAQSFGDPVLGLGGNRNIGGAVWRGDVVVTDTDSGTTAQVVTSLSHSWMWDGRNVSGVLEYYFNGFGQSDGRYDPASLAANPELLKRLARGEVFTLGRHYLAGNASIEMTPLWLLTPTLFVNLYDVSALLQLLTQYSLGNNTTFLGALNIPMGPDGSEYGGIETGTDGQYFSIDFGVFLQLAWYF